MHASHVIHRNARANLFRALRVCGFLLLALLIMSPMINLAAGAGYAAFGLARKAVHWAWPPTAIHYSRRPPRHLIYPYTYTLVAITEMHLGPVQLRDVLGTYADYFDCDEEIPAEAHALARRLRGEEGYEPFDVSVKGEGNYLYVFTPRQYTTFDCEEER